MSIEIMESDYNCGIRSWHFAAGQPCARIIPFMVFYILQSWCKMSFNSLYIGTLTTIEKAFRLSSQQAGFVLTIVDLAYLSSVLFVSYYGGRNRRPLFIGLGGLLSGIGMFIWVMPHWIYFEPIDSPTPVSGDNSTAYTDILCQQTNVYNTSQSSNTSNVITDQSASSSSPAYVFFMFAAISLGVGSSASYSLGTAYIDDNVSTKSSPVYIGYAHAFPFLGIVVGFFIAAATLSVYVTLEDVDFPPTDPRWIGAWWLGFLCLCVLSLTAASPLIFFPKHIKRKTIGEVGRQTEQEIMKQEKAEENDENQEVVVNTFFDKPKEFFRDVVALLKNPVFTWIIVGIIFEYFTIGSYFVFLPKYMETQFGATAQQAAIVNGIQVAMICTGFWAGGYVVKWTKVRLRGATSFTVIVSLLAMSFVSFLMTLQCPDISLQGGLTSDGLWNGNTSCSESCSCEGTPYSPVCGDDMVSYYNPCHAGCTTTVDNSSSSLEIYSDCRCVGNFTATAGMCSPDCGNTFTVYWIGITVWAAVTCPLAMGSVMARLWAIKKEQKTLSLGMFTFFTSALSSLPSPVIMGTVIDGTCLVWSEDGDGDRGNCLLYDKDKFRVLTHGVTIAVYAAAAVCYSVALYFANKVQKRADREKGDGGGASSVSTDTTMAEECEPPKPKTDLDDSYSCQL